MNGSYPTVPRILFASWHYYLDQSNGASISTRALLLELARRGWRVRTLCSYIVDSYGGSDRTLKEFLQNRKFEIRKSFFKDGYYFASFSDAGIDSVAMETRTGDWRPSGEDTAAYLRLLSETIKYDKPDIILTYGGYSLGPYILREARRRRFTVAHYG